MGELDRGGPCPAEPGRIRHTRVNALFRLAPYRRDFLRQVLQIEYGATLMDLMQRKLLETTRRHFFGQCAVGLGQVALASLLRNGKIHAGPQSLNPQSPKLPHFASKAKSVIYLFMAGGPSQLDLFEHKP